jgi:ATP-binding cassette subfamily B protein
MYARFGSDDKIERPIRLLKRAAAMGAHLKWAAAAAAVAAVVATVARLAGPLIVRWGIDSGVLPGEREVITRAALTYLVFLIVQYVANSTALKAVTTVGERYLRRLRVSVYEHLVGLDLDFFGKSKAGVLVSRLTSDIEALTTFSNEGAINVITSTLTVIGVGIGLFLVDTAMALVVLAVMPLLIGASIVFRVYADRAYRRVREQIGFVLGSLQEGISGVRVVQAYNQERSQLRRFHGVNDRYYQANLAAARAISIYFPTVDFLRTASVGLVLYVGGGRVLDGSMTFGSLVAFILYLAWFFEPIIQLSNVYNLAQGALAALSKLFGILDTTPLVREKPDAIGFAEVVEGRIRFENVTFGYDPAIPIVEGLDLEIAPGERLAVVGETGAGKSTIAKLGARFYDPQAGVITIDGIDLRDLRFDALRNAVAMVPQEGFLFAGSVRDNIAYARPEMTDEEVWEVARVLGIEEWLRSLPERLDTEVRERGMRLSSGERQLVSLARAMAADPAVIVLDEATSNLDPETEATVEEALGRLLAGRTAIVIAHRLQTAERADRILVIADGRIAEQGSFDELIAAGGAFARLQTVWQIAEARDHVE